MEVSWITLDSEIMPDTKTTKAATPLAMAPFERAELRGQMVVDAKKDSHASVQC